MWWVMPGVVCRGNGFPDGSHLLFGNVVRAQELTRGICAIDLEAFVLARELLGQAEIVKGRGDVEEFRVEPQLSLAALLGGEQIDPDGVVEEQIAGMLTQDARGLLGEKRIGNARAGQREWTWSCLLRMSSQRCQDDLSFRAGPQAFQHEMSLARIGEGQDYARPYPQLSIVDEPGNLRQLLCRHLDQEERGFDAMPLRKILVRLGDRRNQLAASAQDLERALLRVAADEIDHSVGIPDTVLEPLGPVVDRLRVGAEVAHERRIILRRGRDDLQACPAGELDRIGSNASGCAMNQHRLPRLELAWSNRACRAVTATTGTAAASM